MSLAGLILGYSGLGILLLLVVAILPELIGDRYRHAGESSAVGSLRTINVAEVTYYSEYPDRGYSDTLGQLGPPGQGTNPGPEAAGLIDQFLASGRKSEYHFTYVPGPKDEHGLRATYTVQADPESGNRHFFTDETGVIRAQTGQPAGPNSPPLQ